jgi:predicted MFS family arabinose efflux permease
VLVIKDLTQGTGHFNLASGALATTVGIGSALSNTLSSTLIQYSGFRTSFLALAAVAVLAFLLLYFAMPETLSGLARPAHSLTAVEKPPAPARAASYD